MCSPVVLYRLKNDEGYDVLLARLRGASRTVDEVRGFWKERSVNRPTHTPTEPPS